jgi:hypothetical protein
MDNYIKVLDLEKNKGLINVTFEAVGEITKYLNSKRNLAIEYPFDTIDIPDSMCILPFAGNILPFLFVFDVTLYVDSIDKAFMDSIEDLRAGYSRMYPKMEFKGQIIAKIIEDNSENVGIGRAAALFSGGVDANTTLLRRLEEKPVLVTIGGSDIKLEDLSGWEKEKALTSSAADKYGLDKVFVKSEFRYLYNEPVLDKFLKPFKDGWWHGFHHGIGLLSHMAPISYKLGIGKVYIASSFCADLIGTYTCASDPTIDNYLRFGNALVIHDGYELNRQAKIRYLINSKKSGLPVPKLHVCWVSQGGENCCHCEKCYRTILAIASEGGDPEEFGFKWGKEKIKMLHEDFDELKVLMNRTQIDRYMIPIQKVMGQNKDLMNDYEDYSWFTKLDLHRYSDLLTEKIKKQYSHPRIKKFFRKIRLMH